MSFHLYLENQYDFYTPSNEQHDKELEFITLSRLELEESCDTLNVELYYHNIILTSW